MGQVGGDKGKIKGGIWELGKSKKNFMGLGICNKPNGSLSIIQLLVEVAGSTASEDPKGAKMQPEKQQQKSRKVSIQARAENFSFKLRATKILPTWKLDQFSLLLQLNKFILKLQLKSGSTVSISTQRKRSLKSRFLRLVENLRLRRENKSLSIQHLDVKSICTGSLVIGVLALLLQSISKKDSKGIILHSSIILVSLILYFSRHIKGRSCCFCMVFIVGPVACCWVALHLGKVYTFESLVGFGLHGARLLLLAVGNVAFQVILASQNLLLSHL